MIGSPGRLPLVIGILAALALLVGALFVPFEARNSVAYGLNQSIDFSRTPAIAVNGRIVTPNYPNFDRIDLDLRAYQHQPDYDLTIHIRLNRAGAGDVRTIPLDIPGSKIPDNKAAFANPYITLRFPPIANSAGTSYYVWVERGPRNRDNVIALWSVKTYSRVTGRDVLGAFLDGTDAHRLVTVVLILLMFGFVAGFGWLMGATTALAQSAIRSAVQGRDRVASAGREWYTLPRIARRVSRRAVTYDAHGGADAGPGSPPPQ